MVGGREPTSWLKLPRRRALVTSLLGAFLLLLGSVGASSAAAQAYLPPAGQIFQGEAGTPLSAYERATRRHPAVLQVFSAWHQYLPAMFAQAARVHARLMIQITTDDGPRERITPGQIAAGGGDAWLIALGQEIAASEHPVYIRLMAEMDGYWNPYSAYNADGSPRNPQHSAASYKLAFKRVTLILRGGSVAHINAVLSQLRLPPLNTTATVLPAGQVAMLWVPQLAGSPDIPGNQPLDYYPGRPWVDWVGTDFYSEFPNFAGLSSLYRSFSGLPFVFGEYALSGADQAGFVNRLFSWVGSHPRTRMLIYNQGQNPTGPFRLSRYPLAGRALKKALSGRRFPGFAPDW